MKETFYFSHDFHARSDEKILKLLQKERWEGYGLYWAIVEKIYEAGGWIEKDYDTIAYDLRAEYERITRVIETYDLFIVKDGKISSKSILDRIALREEKSNKARDSVSKRWAKVSEKTEESNTDDIRTYNDSNTIKERKGNQKKEKETIKKNIDKKKKTGKKGKIKDLDKKTEVEAGVFLTSDEDKKTRELYGSFYKRALLKLSSFKISKGQEYAVDYATLHTGGWVYRAMLKDFPGLSEEITKRAIAEEQKRIDEAQKWEKEKVEEEYNKLLAFYNTLSDREKKSINDRADYELRRFTPQMREKNDKQWQNIYKAKVRAVTSTYRDTGEIPEVPPPPAEKETLPPNT